MLSDQEWRQLVKQHGNLIHKIAHQFLNKCQEDYEDLYQMGCIGLLKAKSKFDPKINDKFAAFAIPFIEGEIRHHLRNHWQQIKIPRSILEKRAKINNLHKKLNQMGRSVDAAQIAAIFGIDKAQWAEWEYINRNLSVSWDELLFEPPQKDADEEIEIGEYLAQIPPRYRIPLLEKYFQNLTLAQIAARHGISTALAEARINVALNKLRVIIKKSL